MGISTRDHIGVMASSVSSFPVFDFMSTFLPGLFGVSTPAKGMWAPTDISQDYLYIGIIPAWLAVRSFTVKSMPAVGRISQVLLLLAGLYATGVHTQFYVYLYQHVPGFSFSRRPADAAFYINLLLALIISVTRFDDKCRSRKLTFLIGTILASLVVMDLLYLFGYASKVHQIKSLLVSGLQLSIRLVVFLGFALLIAMSFKKRKKMALASFVVMFTMVDLSFAGRLTRIFCPHYKDSAVAQLYLHPGDFRQHTSSPLLSTLRFAKYASGAFSRSFVRIEAVGGPLAASLPTVYGIHSILKATIRLR